MKRSTFLAFVAPSVAVMLLLIAVPLMGVIWLAVHQSFTRTELVEVTTEVPLFGGLTRTTTRVVPQPSSARTGSLRLSRVLSGRKLPRHRRS
jgi:multiple sugar transport system permease protein